MGVLQQVLIAASPNLLLKKVVEVVHSSVKVYLVQLRKSFKALRVFRLEIIVL